MEIILTEVLLLVAGISKAVMDLIAHEKLSHLGRFFNPKESWKLKYKKDNIGVPRFPLSTTMLVGLTDGWHLFQSIYLNSLFILFAYISNYSSIIFDFLNIEVSNIVAYSINFIVLRFIFGYAFEISYTRIPSLYGTISKFVLSILQKRRDE